MEHKWNIIKHEKAKYKNFLHEWSCLNNDDEYASLHESSKSITEQDEKCVGAIIDYFSQWENSLTTLSSQPITNIVTNEQIDVESITFLLQYLKLGETAYNLFNKYRLQEKTTKLFDTISNIRTVKRSSICVPIFDIKKETASFMRYIDYARTRNYDIKNLLHLT